MTTNDTRTARERAWEAATLAHPVFERRRISFVNGWLARDAEPTTVTAEQLDQAATGIADYIQCQDGGLRPDPVEVWYWAEAAFRAAGFRIEGDPV